ncbi:MAG: DUF1801 domain-containing protein [Chloroflexi bacterium]|nr:DUF1801 domain-containing protein [Chloroflexota bacterium]
MTTTDPAEPLLKKIAPEVRPLVQQLREKVKDAMPGTTEKVHLGWGAIHYSAGGKMRDVVIAIHPQRAYVNLEFGDGVDLPDPAGRLEGTGKRLRHVKIRSAEDIRDADVRRLLEEQARRRGLL